jgi:hypothetical protein
VHEAVKAATRLGIGPWQGSSELSVLLVVCESVTEVIEATEYFCGECLIPYSRLQLQIDEKTVPPRAYILYQAETVKEMRDAQAFGVEFTRGATRFMEELACL